MLLEPEAHRWEHVSSEDIGEPGCRHWPCAPRFGLIGMFLNWWRVVISSGCPLARALMGRRSRKRGSETTRARSRCRAAPDRRAAGASRSERAGAQWAPTGSLGQLPALASS